MGQELRKRLVEWLWLWPRVFAVRRSWNSGGCSSSGLPRHLSHQVVSGLSIQSLSKGQTGFPYNTAASRWLKSSRDNPTVDKTEAALPFATYTQNYFHLILVVMSKSQAYQIQGDER